MASKLVTPRQLVALTTLSNLAAETRERALAVRSGIEEGDTVRITRVASHTYHFEKA